MNWVAAGNGVTSSTLFQAGSISKPVAALGAIVLVQQGRLGLDEDVNGRLSCPRGCRKCIHLARPVTLREIVLSQRAGLIRPRLPGYVAGRGGVNHAFEVLDGVNRQYAADCGRLSSRAVAIRGASASCSS